MGVYNGSDNDDDGDWRRGRGRDERMIEGRLEGRVGEEMIVGTRQSSYERGEFCRNITGSVNTIVLCAIGTNTSEAAD